MPRPLTPFRQNSFLGLSDDAGVEVRPGQLQTLLNLYRVRDKLKIRRGTTPLGNSDLYPAVPVDGLFWCRISSADRLFTPHGGQVYDLLHSVYPYLVPSSTGRLTSGRAVNPAILEQKVYLSDGVNPLFRLNGTNAARALPTTPPTPTLTDNGVGVLPANPSYRIVWLSADGAESAPCAATSIALAANRQVAVTRPAIPGGQDISGWRLYRLPSGSTTYRLVTTISDTTTTITIDNNADAAITGNSPLATTDRTAFPPCSLLIEHAGRLIGARCDDATSGDRATVYISNYREPYYCPVLPTLTDPNQGTRITIPGALAGEITGLVSHGGRVYVFTAGEMHVLIGDQPLEFAVKPFAPHGCIAHRTIQRLENRIFWAAADGVYMAVEGQGLQRISDDLETSYRAISISDLSNMHAAVYDSKYFLMWPNGAWWYDVRYNIWGQNSNWPWNVSAAGLYQGTNTPRLFAGRAATPRVWELETGAVDYGTDGVAISLKTRDDDFGLPGHEKRLHYVGATFKAKSSSQEVFIIARKGTGSQATLITHDLSTLPEAGATLSRLDERVADTMRDEHFSVAMDAAVTDGDFELYSIDGRFTLAT